MLSDLYFRLRSLFRLRLPRHCRHGAPRRSTQRWRCAASEKSSPALRGALTAFRLP